MPAVAIKFRFLSTAFPWLPSTVAALSTTIGCMPVEVDYTVSCITVASTYDVSCLVLAPTYVVACQPADLQGLYPLTPDPNAPVADPDLLFHLLTEGDEAILTESDEFIDVEHV